ncbi:MAG: transcriptional repressor [Bacteroidota bacterium]
MKDPVEILKSHNLKHTWQRVRVLEEIALDQFALSQPELEKKLGKEIDRVTLYRILNTYEDKGILHRVMDINGTANYAICSPSCKVHEHHDEHVHFNCSNCLKIYCLEVSIPKLKLPKGFKANAASLTAYGICENCNTN